MNSFFSFSSVGWSFLDCSLLHVLLDLCTSYRNGRLMSSLCCVIFILWLHTERLSKWYTVMWVWHVKGLSEKDSSLKNLSISTYIYVALKRKCWRFFLKQIHRYIYIKKNLYIYLMTIMHKPTNAQYLYQAFWCLFLT